MRILHTADWHLGKTVEGRSRQEEQEEFVDELVRIAEEEQVDLVLIAGDVYQSVNPSSSAEGLYYEALARLSDSGRRGVVVIAGNHDHPERIRAAKPLAQREGIVLSGYPRDNLHPSSYPSSSDRTPRVRHVDGGVGWVELSLPGVEHHAVVLALPYPSEARLQEVLSERLSEEQLQQHYSERVALWFQQAAAAFRPDTVNLAMSHFYVAGGRMSDSEIQIQLGGAYAVEPTALPPGAQYVALGHLHRPQWVAQSPVPARYAGSPLAYSFSEEGQAKSVTLVEAVPGQSAQVREIYLSSGKPMVRWVAEKGWDQFLSWCLEGRDVQAWVDATVYLDAPLSFEQLAQVRKLHPGLIHIRPIFPEMESIEQQPSPSHMPLEEQFRQFYQQQRGVSPPDELVDLFLSLLESEEQEEAELPEKGESIA